MRVVKTVVKQQFTFEAMSHTYTCGCDGHEASLWAVEHVEASHLLSDAALRFEDQAYHVLYADEQRRQKQLC